MSISELNKRRVRQFFDEVLNESRFELIDELVARDFIGRHGGAPLEVSGPAGVRRFVAQHLAACPGLYVKIEDQIAEDDRVVTRWQATTVAVGLAGVVDTSGLRTQCAGITIVRLLAGKQVDAHTYCNGPTAVSVAVAGAATGW